MFARRVRGDSDAAAIARRRLAALAAQFEAAPEGISASTAASVESPATAIDAEAPPPSARPSASQPTAPHRADSPDPDWIAHWSDGSDEHATPAADGGSTVGRHAARRIPDEYGRWSLTAHQVTVVALLVAAVVAVAAWLVLRSMPHAAPVQLTSERSLPATASPPPTNPSAPPATAPPGGALATPAAQASSGGPLVVDVAGKVRRPGIVELPAGARVVDAIRAAGGARPGVSTTSLNLARLLVDGEQIVVGLNVPAVDLVVPSPAIPGTSTATAIASVDLNTASQEELETLPGIGPVTAASILAWRTENGAFTSVDELLEVSGIGDVTLSNIEAYVHV